MRDGKTHRLDRSACNGVNRSFLETHEVKLVVVSGGAAGTEIELDQERTVVGRGPGVDVALDDTTMSRQHAVIEVEDTGFRIRDLGSTNGVSVNHELTVECLLGNGDHVEIGCHEFQVVIEDRVDAPNTYLLSPDA